MIEIKLWLLDPPELQSVYILRLRLSQLPSSLLRILKRESAILSALSLSLFLAVSHIKLVSYTSV